MKGKNTNHQLIPYKLPRKYQQISAILGCVDHQLIPYKLPKHEGEEYQSSINPIQTTKEISKTKQGNNTNGGRQYHQGGDTIPTKN